MKRPKKHAQWTTHKLARLRQCYRSMSKAELVAEFAPHPIRSIRLMANQMGLRRPIRNRDWIAICAQHKPVIFRGPPVTT